MWGGGMAVQTEECFGERIRFGDADLMGLLPVYRTKAAAQKNHPSHQIVQVQRVEECPSCP